MGEPRRELTPKLEWNTVGARTRSVWNMARSPLRPEWEETGRALRRAPGEYPRLGTGIKADHGHAQQSFRTILLQLNNWIPHSFDHWPLEDSTHLRLEHFHANLLQPIHSLCFDPNQSTSKWSNRCGKPRWVTCWLCFVLFYPLQTVNPCQVPVPKQTRPVKTWLAHTRMGAPWSGAFDWSSQCRWKRFAASTKWTRSWASWTTRKLATFATPWHWQNNKWTRVSIPVSIAQQHSHHPECLFS